MMFQNKRKLITNNKALNDCRVKLKLIGRLFSLELLFGFSPDGKKHYIKKINSIS